MRKKNEENNEKTNEQEDDIFMIIQKWVKIVTSGLSIKTMDHKESNIWLQIMSSIYLNQDHSNFLKYPYR